MLNVLRDTRNRLSVTQHLPRSIPSRGWHLSAGLRRRGALDLDAAVVIQVQCDQLAVGTFEGEPVEPQLVVLRVGEPTSGLLLLVGDDGAAHLVGPRVIAVRNLLRDPHRHAGLQSLANGIIHGGDCSRDGGSRHAPRAVAYGTRSMPVTSCSRARTSSS